MSANSEARSTLEPSNTPDFTLPNAADETLPYKTIPALGALEYVLALIIGVFFQYAALASMTLHHGLSLWCRAFKVDLLSLTAWQIGMYGWMAIAVFLLIGPMSPTDPTFWFMMQIGMFCGFITSYPMNWWLMSIGIKKVM